MQPFGSSFLSEKSIGRIFPFAIPLVVVLLAYTLLQGDLEILLILYSLLLFFLSTILIHEYQLAMQFYYLLSKGYLTAHNEDVSVKLLAVLSYWLLVVGIVCMVIDLFRKKRPVKR